MDGKIIYSTLSQDNLYVFYSELSHDGVPRRIVRKILIRGGANVVDRKGRNAPSMMTRITDEEWQCLLYGVNEQGKPRNSLDPKKQKHVTFEEHELAGFVFVSETQTSTAKAAKNMTPKDGSAQPTREELIKLGYKPMPTAQEFSREPFRPNF